MNERTSCIDAMIIKELDDPSEHRFTVRFQCPPPIAVCVFQYQYIYFAQGIFWFILTRVENNSLDIRPPNEGQIRLLTPELHLLHQIYNTHSTALT